MTYSINPSTIRHSVTGYGCTRTSWEMKTTASSRERTSECSQGGLRGWCAPNYQGWEPLHRCASMMRTASKSTCAWPAEALTYATYARSLTQGVQGEEDHARRQCTANASELPLLDGTPHWRVEVLRVAWHLLSALDELQWMGKMSVFT